MTTIIDLLGFEEGWRDRPYLCSEGYPTVGYGFKLGPKLSHGEYVGKLYDFVLPKAAGDAWLEALVVGRLEAMARHPAIAPALDRCFKDCSEPYRTNPRVAVLISMAFQMGVEGLAQFFATLNHVAKGRYELAAGSMMKSKWAQQTPRRARRHAEQMRTGQWDGAYRK